MTMAVLLLCIVSMIVAGALAAVMHHRDKPILGLAAVGAMLVASVFAIVYGGIESQ